MVPSFFQAGYLSLLQHLVEHADGALHRRLAYVGRQASALHGAVGGDVHRGGSVVLDAVGDGEQVLRIDLDLAVEGEASGRGVGQLQRMGRGERALRGLGPERGLVRSAWRADPAGDGVVGVVGAQRPQQFHRRRARVGGLAVLLQEQVVEARAGEVDRSGEFRRVHRHARTGCEGLGAGQLGRGRLAVRREAFRRLGRGHGVRLRGLGLVALVGRPHDELLIGHDQHEGHDDEDDEVAVVVGLHRARGVPSGGGSRRVKRGSGAASRPG